MFSIYLHLQILRFSHNNVTELPMWLGKDQLLTHIDANSNRMSGLPENMRYSLIVYSIIKLSSTPPPLKKRKNLI